jgi:hypothetical protein
VDALNGIQFELTAGQITQKGFDGWVAELLEFQNIHGTLQISGDEKNNPPKLAYWSYYAKKTAINVLINKSKSVVSILPRCNTLVDISLIPIFKCIDQTKSNLQKKATKSIILVVV